MLDHSTRLSGGRFPLCPERPPATVWQPCRVDQDGEREAATLARTFHTRVAADVSRRHLSCGQNAPTDVGGYTLSVNCAECEISELVAQNGLPAERGYRPKDGSNVILVAGRPPASSPQTTEPITARRRACANFLCGGRNHLTLLTLRLRPCRTGAGCLSANALWFPGVVNMARACFFGRKCLAIVAS